VANATRTWCITLLDEQGNPTGGVQFFQDDASALLGARAMLRPAPLGYRVAGYKLGAYVDITETFATTVVP
jgi:hypothetical protein